MVAALYNPSRTTKQVGFSFQPLVSAAQVAKSVDAADSKSAG